MEAITGIIQSLQRKRVIRLMRGREALTADQFGSRFFTSEKARIAVKVRDILGRHFPMDVSRIHPNDELVRDLRMPMLNTLSIFQFLLDIEEEFCVFFDGETEETFRTLRDVVDFVASKTRVRSSVATMPLTLKGLPLEMHLNASGSALKS